MDFDTFKVKAEEISSYFNSIITDAMGFKSKNQYSLKNVVFISSLTDYNDGKGVVLLTTISISNPIDNIPDFSYNSLGNQEVAFNEAMKYLKDNKDKMIAELKAANKIIKQLIPSTFKKDTKNLN